MRIFISYTTRDNSITKYKLQLIEDYFSHLGDLYIDLLHNSSCIPQLKVIIKLICCNKILLIETPEVYNSPWVKFELFLGRLLSKPIEYIPLSEIESFLSIKQ